MRTSEHPVFENLPAELRSRVERETRLLAIPAGQRVFQPGQVCSGLPLVLSGTIRVQMTGCAGHEIVLYRVAGGEVCALSIGCLIAGRGYRAEAIAESDTSVALMPPRLFDDLLAASAEFRRIVMTAYGERLDTLMLVVEEVAFRRMDERLSGWLEERSGQGPLAITHQQLAVELGTAREVVSRLLKDFERQGRVQLFRGKIEILS
ncbi:MAG: Crp/Fnr family transcriptional regulator [Ectothiorhodospiraceae bacterium]|nr:Crp/Fnr family transcriptional regulator [Ectothiorhodospiraceae bacterium]